MTDFRRMMAPAGALACAAALTLLSSCGGSDGGTGPSTPTPTTLSLSPAAVTLSYIGATSTVTARILDQNGSPLTGAVTWVSDGAGVATVTSPGGSITAVGNGTTTVRAASGSLSATVTVTVQQEVSGLEVVSGNAQSGLAGAALTEAVVVRAKDLGGATVAGATVTFTPEAGSGTVDPATAVTDAQGLASTVWTMGESFGTKKLTATSASGTAFLSAKSLSPVPLPDLVTVGALSVQRPDPSTLDTVVVRAKVRNDGDIAAGAFRVRLRADGAEIASAPVTELAPAEETTVAFTLDPFDAGTYALILEVDPDGAVEELVESNNQVQGGVTVVKETLLQGENIVPGLGATKDEELRFRLDLALPANNLTVELGGGTGDVDLFIERGQRPSTREEYNDCQSGSPTTVERCQLTGVEAGSYYILLHAFSTFSGTTMTISLDGQVLPYNIEVLFIDHGTARQDSAFTAAAERWMQLLPVDLSDIDFSSQPIAAGTCLDGQPLVNDVVDDIRIFVSIDSIDGSGGTLAQAAPCVTRGLGHLPLIGFMEFDEIDVAALDASGELGVVALHEMAHVLGFGTIWGLTGDLQNPSLPSNSGADTFFDGPLAIAAFDAAGGTAYTKGQKVPVENKATSGSSDSHWRESVLGRELMTPAFNQGLLNPLSAITVKSMEDLGYQVDATKADPYSGNFGAPSRISGADRPAVDLSDDVPRRPLIVVDQKGRVVEIRR